MEATKASSGSTAFAFENGAGTTDGEDEAGTVTPPSNVQVCSREYLPLRKSGPVRFQLMRALCSDILVSRMIRSKSQARKCWSTMPECVNGIVPRGILWASFLDLPELQGIG